MKNYNLNNSLLNLFASLRSIPLMPGDIYAAISEMTDPENEEAQMLALGQVQANKIIDSITPEKLRELENSLCLWSDDALGHIAQAAFQCDRQERFLEAITSFELAITDRNCEGAKYILQKVFESESNASGRISPFSAVIGCETPAVTTTVNHDSGYTPAG